MTLQVKLSSTVKLIPLETHFKIAKGLRVGEEGARSGQGGEAWSHRGKEEQLREFCQGPKF